MACNSSDPKRRRSSGSGDEEDQKDKKQRLEDPRNLASASQLVQAINVDWSTSGPKRRRSRSNEIDVRNVRARMTVDLSSSNPEPTNFLMGTIANELDLISQTLLTSSPASTLKGSNITSITHSPQSSRQSPSPQSSPDYYDKLVMRGNEILERITQDPDLIKYL